MNKKQKKMLLRIIIAAVLIVVFSLLPAEGYLRFVLFMIPYLVIGYDILKKAFKGILNKQVFDENFLMAVATVGAILLGDYSEGVAVMLFYQIGELFQSYAVGKSRRNISELMDIRPDYANIEKDGTLEQVDPDEVEIGTIIVVQPGEKVPIDGVITEGTSTLNTSALTGESLPVEKSLDEVPEGAALGDQTNRVFSGSFVTYGRASYEVTEVGMSTEVGKIAGLLKNASEKQTPLQKNLDDFGKKLSITILVFCGILFAISVNRGESIVNAFLFAVALAVAAIPEALSSIVTIVLSFGTQKMAKEHAIIRKLQAVEGLGSVSIICSDKTGTLTQNKMTVENYYVNGESVCSGEIDLKDPAQRELLMFSMLCNDSTNHDGQEIGDPTETALINLGSLLGEDYAQVREEYPRLSEVPFDSDRKLMSTEHFIDGRYVMVVKGAVDVLLDRMSHIQDGDILRKITEEDRVRIEVQNKHFSENGLRVLAFAFKTMEQEQGLTLNDENDLTFLGLISMMDPPRVESKDAVAECIKAGIKPIMITGDHKVTAAAIAKRIGILENMSEACEGAVIEDMTDEELQDFVPQIYARVSPEHKIRIVRAWQERGNIVAMTGDGVNDAPALKQSDIGVAMGITGSEVAKDAAAMVLTDDNFATIVKAVENGRNIFQNIKNAIQFLLSGNFAAILAVLYASLASLPVPFAPVHLLFINLLTDSLPAIALGLEPHNPEVMKEKPRAMGESILTKPFLTSIGVEGLCIGIMTMTAFMIGYRDGNAVLASTMAFGTLCSSRLVHGFNCKANKPIIFMKRFWNNIYLIGAFVLGWLLITGVLMIPALQGMFKVQTLTVAQLMTVYGLALLNLPVIQLLKWIRTRKK